MLWVGTVSVLALPFAVGLPHRWNELIHPCETGCPDPRMGALTAEQVTALADLGVPLRLYVAAEVGRELALAVVCVVLGTLLIRRVGSWVAYLTATVVVAFGAVLVPETPLAGERVDAVPEWLTSLSWLLAACTIAVVWFLLPSGRLTPRWALIPLLVTLAVWIALTSGDHESDPHPALMGLALVMICFGIGAQVHHYRRASTAVERQQLKWLGIGLLGWIGSLGAYLAAVEARLVDASWDGVLYPLAWVAFGVVATSAALIFPFAWAMAILEHRLWDADRVLSRAVLAVAVTVGLALTYVGTAFVVATLADDIAGPVAAVVLVVIALVGRDPVKRRVTRLFYGQRDAPFELLAGLWSTANRLPADAKTLSTLTRHLVESLHLSAGSVAISGSRGAVDQEIIGNPVGEATDVALEFGGDHVGVLRVWPRGGETALRPKDVQLITEAAAPLAHLAATVRLTTELRRSQAALVDAREEERRRMHRDLHDDLGPALAGQSLILDALRATLDEDPRRAREFADLAKRRTDAVIEQIRRLSRDLRPAALDQLGLEGSLRQAASVADNADLAVRAEIGRLPPLPAAVETTAYRIVTEALTNAVRHAGAATITIRLATDGDALVAEVADDGRGGAPTCVPVNGSGVGLRSIHDRATQLGGEVAVHSPPGEGTTVQIRLPTSIDA